ncbi:MAG TPA: ABC transporter permease [Acetobacteraceae bacterium]|jgi:peptide/nickel transport system permease protein|nr:ABC transporter permease [Acetobacteraceae bacterium]
MTATPTAAPPLLAPPSRLRRLTAAVGGLPNAEALVGIAVIVVWVVLIAAAPLIARFGPLTQHIASRLQPPSAVHWFGTDQLGRDVFARVLYGGRESLPGAVAVVALGFLAGVSLGALAGYCRGFVDEVVMRFTDIVLAFPLILLAMAVAAALGPSLTHGILALAAVWWPSYARVCRGLVLELNNKEYVVASRASGRRSASVLVKVILPNALPALLVMAAIDIGRAILIFSILGFLGLGAQPPQPEWGAMVATGATVMGDWWVATFPAMPVLTLALAFNLIGDSIRDALDPWVGGRGR